jgi:hypothetical protein
MTEEPTPHLIDPEASVDTPAADEPVMSANEDFVADEAAVAEPEPEPVSASGDRDEPAVAEEGPVHRPLIRATLPRPEGQKDARPLPEFTVRHSGNRAGNGNYREARGNRAGNNARGQGGHRFGGPRGNGRGSGGRSAGAGGGFRSQHPRHGGGGKKRSR